MATNNAINQIGKLPAFMAINGPEQTGITSTGGSYSTIAFGTKVYDVTNSYDNSTYTFTAPLTGRYSFQVLLGLYNCTASMTGLSINLYTTQSNYILFFENFAPGQAVGGFYVFAANNSVVVPMNSGDTASVRVALADGASLSISGSTGSGSNTPIFSGYMIAGI